MASQSEIGASLLELAEVLVDDQERDGHDLQRGLALPQKGCAHDDALAGREAAKRRDQELPGEDHHDHPSRRHVELDQRDERGRDEDLVGGGIEQLAELRDLLAPPRDESVQEVRQRGEQEHPEADERLALELGQQNDDEQRNQEDPEERQDVGNGQDMRHGS